MDCGWDLMLLCCCVAVLLLSVERDQEWGKGGGLYMSFERVNPTLEDEELDMKRQT